MGILDKIKKFFSEEKIDTPIKDVPESSDSITSKKQELKVKAEKQVKEFILHLKDKIIELENLDFSKRKENEKLKLVVKENFALYLEYLRKLIVDLEKPFDIPKLIVIINNFVKFSTPAFEKATFLIGEELGEAKQQINSFLKEISQLSQEYHIISEKESKINAKKMVMDKIEEIKKIQVESTSKIENCNFKIVQQKDKKNKLENEISEMKQSKEYALAQEEKTKRVQEIKKLEKEIEKIKEKIDFKLLSSLFHTNESKNRIIKDYADNFRKALEEDKKFEIIELVKATNFDISPLSTIKANIDFLKRENNSEIETIINASEEKIKAVDNEIQSLLLEIKEESKKIEKAKEKIELLENDL